MSTVIGGDGDDGAGSGETTYDGLYVVDDLAMSNGMEVPDIFSNDQHQIEDTPEATAEFESLVNELDFAPTAAEPGIPYGNLLYSPVGLSTATSSPTPMVSVGTVPTMSQFLSSPSSATVINSNFAHVGEDENPDRLDLRSLGTPHALPLNVAADANIHVAEATSTNSMAFSSSVLAEPDALAAHLALPVSTRSWATHNISPPHNRSHEVMMNARVAGASSRGRPRVREMKHLPDRNPTSCAPAAPVQMSSSAAPSAAKLRYSKGAAPSKYCHVCGRSAKTVSVALCGNNRLGLCRKVVCDKCLLMHQRESWDLAKSAGAGWICMHCRNKCPERARCHQYQRNNLKRRMRASSSPVASSPIYCLPPVII